MMITHFEEGQEYAEWEPISWLLALLEGGAVDPNKNSSQITDSLPYKTNVRLVQGEDFDLIAKFTGMTEATRSEMDDVGLYRWGLEISSLQQSAWVE